MRMNLLYVHSLELGYGRMGVKMADAIERAGVEVFDDMPSPRNVGAQKFIPHTKGKTAICEHVGWLSTPGHCRGWWEGQSRSILTMWESDQLPEPFRANLDGFDVVIVPSLQNQELFSKYHGNVHYVPLGIDPAEWYPVRRPGLEERWFTFLISGGGYRKGSDLVIDAFRKVFDSPRTEGPPPRLLVHSAKSSEFPLDDRIQLITGKLTDEEERALYSMAHVYVQPSRGEGFGLRPLQAIAQGCVTIATAAHGHAAFADLITYPLSSVKQETPPQSFHHGPAGSWWEPDFDELCLAMEDAYVNYQRRVEYARVLADVARTTLNWDRTAGGYLHAIGADRLGEHEVAPDQWVKSAERLYLVRVRTPRFFEAGGMQYILEPGIDYWETADVKRVLFDSGELDLTCLPQNMADDPREHGLTEEQAAKLGQYSGRMALCPTCHQRLNTNDPTLEELEALPVPAET